MLSAVAARKAAQASHATVEDANTIPEVERASESEEEEVIASVKRKLSVEHPMSRSQKKKQKRKETSAPRYFKAQQDAIQRQGDIVESDEGSVTSNRTSDDMSLSPKEQLPVERVWTPSMPLRDSSDEEGEEPLSKEPQISTSPVTTLTTFKPILNQNVFHFSQAQLQEVNLSPASGTLLVLSTAETVCITGAYQLTVLQGTVSLLGTNLDASAKAHRVFAPKSSPLPVIEVFSSESSFLDVESSRRLGIFGASGAVILIQELRTGVQGLSRVCKIFSGVFDFMQEEARQWKEKVLQVQGAYVLRSRERHYEPYILQKSWATALEEMDLPLTGGIYFVKGPKKSGKSTFARTLLNRLLSRFERVAYLECDLGQSEFTPGGMVALHVIQDYCLGPPFTHPTIPTAAHYIGGTSPRSSPGDYLASVQALFQTFELDICNPLLPYDNRIGIFPEKERISDTVPLVVNTMGWHKGLGADLTRRIQEFVQPTHLFDFCAQKSFGIHDFPESGMLVDELKPHSYFQLDPIVPSPVSPLHTQYTPTDDRVINILSYLYAAFPPLSSERTEPSTVSLEQITATSWKTALPLCSQPPYAVDWNIALDRIVLVGAGTEDVIPSEVGHVLNGALVGLVSSWGDDSVACAEQEMGDVDGQPSPRLPYVQGASPPTPASSTCFGLALIRSVSHFSPLVAPSTTSGIENVLHVLTPVPASLLMHSRIFVKGEMELPVWGMLDHSGGEDGWKKGVAGVEWGKVPYLQWGKGEGIGAERRRVRRNLMRKAQM